MTLVVSPESTRAEEGQNRQQQRQTKTNILYIYQPKPLTLHSERYKITKIQDSAKSAC